MATSVARTTSSQSTQRTAPWGIQIWVVANSPGVCAYHHANLEDPMHSTITLSCVLESSSWNWANGPVARLQCSPPPPAPASRRLPSLNTLNL